MISILRAKLHKKYELVIFYNELIIIFAGKRDV